MKFMCLYKWNLYISEKYKMLKLAEEKYKIITIKEFEMIIKNVPPQIL